MTKVVYNACYGGFGVSEAAMRRYAELKGFAIHPERDGKYAGLGIVTYWTVPASERPASFEGDTWSTAAEEQCKAYNEAYSRLTISDRDFVRHDPILVQVVEELGDKANGRFSALKIAEVPSGVGYRIDEYDGNERVMTSADYEWTIAP